MERTAELFNTLFSGRETFDKNNKSKISEKHKYIILDLKNLIRFFIPFGIHVYNSNFKSIESKCEKFLNVCKSFNFKIFIIISNLKSNNIGNNMKEKYSDDISRNIPSILNNTTQLLIGIFKKYMHKIFGYQENFIFYCNNYDIVNAISYKVKELDGNCIILSDNQKFLYVNYGCENVDIFNSFDIKSNKFVKKYRDYNDDILEIMIPDNVELSYRNINIKEENILVPFNNVVKIIDIFPKLKSIRIFYYYYLIDKKLTNEKVFYEEYPILIDEYVRWVTDTIDLEDCEKPSGYNLFKNDIKSFIEEYVFDGSEFVNEFRSFNIQKEVKQNYPEYHKQVYSNFVFWIISFIVKYRIKQEKDY